MVARVEAGVDQVRDDQLGHERLELEGRVRILALADPPLHIAHELREVLRVPLLACPDELQMERNTGQQPLAAVLSDEVAPVIAIALVKDRDDIDAEP